MTDENNNTLTGFQKAIIPAILLSALMGVVFGLLRKKGLDGSALLYIGMPTMIALAFAMVPSAQSVVGATLKGITFVTLMSGPLLQEGFICMIMAAPIFYIVGALAAYPFDYYRRKKEREQDVSKLNVMIVPSILMLLSMEGTMDELTFDRQNVVERSQIVSKSIAEVRQGLSGSRELATPSSLFSRLFPRPAIVKANGIEVGDSQTVDLSYFKWLVWNEKKGSTVFVVSENEPYRIRFRPETDDSYITSYLEWGDTEVILHPLDGNRTQVTWRIYFKRKLDPAWYVQPLQRYAVGNVADLMITSLK